MSLRVRTETGKELLQALRTAIDDGSVSTWQYDDDGDFTHTSDELIGEAWLRPTVKGKSLVFSLLGQRDTVMNSSTYASYHGQFIEMLLMQFDTYFDSVLASSFADDDDYFETSNTN